MEEYGKFVIINRESRNALSDDGFNAKQFNTMFDAEKYMHELRINPDVYMITYRYFSRKGVKRNEK